MKKEKAGIKLTPNYEALDIEQIWPKNPSGLKQEPQSRPYNRGSVTW